MNYVSAYKLVLIVAFLLAALFIGAEVVQAGRGWCHPLSSCG
jgi:hypothetical protein